MKFKAFTLAELLIALAILGVIATFTIPKVLTSQNNAKYNAMAKEAAGAVYAAYQDYTLNNGKRSSLSTDALMPYLNYVSRDTVSQIDDRPSVGGTISCSNSWETCLRMHNGGMLRLLNNQFGGTANTNAILFGFDPDAKVTGNASGLMVGFRIYYDGLITSEAGLRSNTYDSTGGPYGPGAVDPVWFSWN